MKKAHLWLTGLIFCTGMVHVNHALASENQSVCSSVVPADATISKSLYLCEANVLGKTDTYACQEMVSEQGKYRLLFQGGSTPVVVMMQSADGRHSGIIWTKEQSASQPVCALPADTSLPAGMAFIGAGVCHDTQDRSVPCSVFRQKQHRQSMVTDHLYLYDRDGGGVLSSEIVHTRTNTDAMPAEFAYQLGLSLLNTTCCKQQGLDYIHYAYQLFPGAKLYRETYQQFSDKLMVQNKLSLRE